MTLLMETTKKHHHKDSSFLKPNEQRAVGRVQLELSPEQRHSQRWYHGQEPSLENEAMGFMAGTCSALCLPSLYHQKYGVWASSSFVERLQDNPQISLSVVPC